MIDPGLAYHYMYSQREWDNKNLRAQIRALEARCGESDSEEGRYWLRRTAALEYVLSAAERAVKLEPGMAFLSEAIEAVDAVAPPACRDGDHANA